MSFSKLFQLCTQARITKLDHVQSNCSWDIFLWKNSSGLHTFRSFSKTFQLCTHARITNWEHV